MLSARDMIFLKYKKPICAQPIKTKRPVWRRGVGLAVVYTTCNKYDVEYTHFPILCKAPWFYGDWRPDVLDRQDALIRAALHTLGEVTPPRYGINGKRRFSVLTGSYLVELKPLQCRSTIPSPV